MRIATQCRQDLRGKFGEGKEQWTPINKTAINKTDGSGYFTKPANTHVSSDSLQLLFFRTLTLYGIYIGLTIYRLRRLLTLDPRDVRLGNHIPRSHILLQALGDAAVLLRGDGVLRLQDALVETVLGDFVDQLSGVCDRQFLADLLLELCFDWLRLQRWRRSASEESHGVGGLSSCTAEIGEKWIWYVHITGGKIEGEAEMA